MSRAAWSMFHHVQLGKSNMQLVFLKRNTSAVGGANVDELWSFCDHGVRSLCEPLAPMCILIAYHLPSLTAKIYSTAGPNQGWNRTMKDKTICNWYFFLTSHSQSPNNDSEIPGRNQHDHLSWPAASLKQQNFTHNEVHRYGTDYARAHLLRRPPLLTHSLLQEQSIPK